jgi:hypothetical protein
VLSIVEDVPLERGLVAVVERRFAADGSSDSFLGRLSHAREPFATRMDLGYLVERRVPKAMPYPLMLQRRESCVGVGEVALMHPIPVHQPSAAGSA